LWSMVKRISLSVTKPWGKAIGHRDFSDLGGGVQ
jgi:hypothetical protein